MRTLLTLIISVTMPLVSFVSCCPKDSVPESLLNVKDVVAKLDAEVASMYGWEPRDSTYDRSLDTLVTDLMEEYEAYNPEVKLTDGTVPAIQQQAYDEARVTWAEFKRLCDGDMYREALEFYLGTGDDYIKKNAGDFLVFLKHSTHRFMFYSQALLPLMREYKGEEAAIEDYISNLQLEKAIEDGTIAFSAENTGYVPEAYPYVIRELGSTLVSVGRMDEAQEMYDDCVDAIYALTGDALNAIFSGTYYSAYLYLQGDEPDLALETWEVLRDYLEANGADFDPEDLAGCLARVEREIVELQSDTL